MTQRIRAGLCSVTFRDLEPEQVIETAQSAGLHSIEWGTDVHVPLGDLDRAARVGDATRDAGLVVASLGSYFRCDPDEAVEPLLRAASVIGAPRIRIWAGRTGSANTGADERSRIVSTVRSAAETAAEHGIELALEYHGGTLTDTAESTRRLLDDVAHDGLSTYWQPSVGAPDDVALAELALVAPWVSTLHVFSWWPHTERRALRDRATLWEPVLAYAQTLPNVTDALLEFVPHDDPAALPREAETLRGWLR